MAERTIFDEIVDGTVPSWKIWEDDSYLAFLTPFANTPGAAVVIPKKNPGDYVFSLDDGAIAGLMAAAKKAANLIERALGVDRVAAVFEGEAVPHVHVKLYPMHRAASGYDERPRQQVFFPSYPGYITTIEGPRMSDGQMDELQARIRQAGRS